MGCAIACPLQYPSDASRQECFAEDLDRGIEQGIEQGRKAEKLEIARSLLNQLPAEAISQTTGLTIAEIEQLRSDLKGELKGELKGP